MIKVNVICGGTSNEREVSLRSGTAVAEGLKASGYEAVILDTDESNETTANCDVVFPVLHGAGGEDGEFQARLEKLGVPFVGTGSTASSLCMDKSLYRESMISEGLLMAKGTVVNKNEYLKHPLVSQPHVLKPIDGGSSIDTHIIRDIDSFDQKSILDSFDRYPTMLLEELIIGVEATVGILDDQALPVIEIIPPSDGEFDFENKYNGQTQELCPPKNISEKDQRAIQGLAVKAHQVAGCRDFSRSDFIITPKSDYYLLETNTIPGMTDQSLYPKMAAQIGLPMPKLTDELVNLALSRK